MRLPVYPILLGLVIPVAAALAQDTRASTSPHSAEHQIASAILPLPEEFRSTATVLGYSATGKLTTLRSGSGQFTCLASAPGGERFHVACYHRSLEAFMARGRELRAAGVADTLVDGVRNADIEAGRLQLPNHPAALYSLTGPPESYDPATGSVTGARPLFVIYVPFATPESLGLSATPAEGRPWIMNPGTPKAHIMFVPRM